MNSRTAKLIRKYSSIRQSDYRQNKRAWNRNNRVRRAVIRKEIQQAVENVK